MRGVKQISGSTGRMKKHRYSREFKVTAVKLATHPCIETQEVAAALNIHPAARGSTTSSQCPCRNYNGVGGGEPPPPTTRLGPTALTSAGRDPPGSAAFFRRLDPRFRRAYPGAPERSPTMSC